MQRKYWLGAAAGALAVVAVTASSQAAPLSAGGSDVRAAAGEASNVQTVHWDRRYYRGHYYAPRRHYRDYGYRYYRPYRHYGYGYGPGFGFYAGPRHHHRGWW
jgi:hypothetical protein